MYTMGIFHWLCACLFAVLCCSNINAHEVLVLESHTFEVSITEYEYIAILFFDQSVNGRRFEALWEESADIIESLPSYANMAKIDVTQSDLKEIIEAYDIPIPSIQLFRDGNLVHYRGPTKDSFAIADFIREDCKPPVSVLSSMQDVRQALKKAPGTSVLGFFRVADLPNVSNREVGTEEEISENWTHFQTVANSFRGHINFYAISSLDLFDAFGLQIEDVPTAFLVTGENHDVSRYDGPFIDTLLSEWLYRNISPPMEALSLATMSSQQYAAQFFSSRKMKFILLLPDEGVFSDDGQTFVTRDELLAKWEIVSSLHKDSAIFSYMVVSKNPIVDVLEYFEADVNRDIPCIVAHNPLLDSRFKSPKFRSPDVMNEYIDFVEGVVLGRISKILRSDTIPKNQFGLVTKTVGKTVLNLVSQSTRDVLLVVYATHHMASKEILLSLEMLAKAVQGESRILIAKLDASLNDVPTSWNVKNFPTLLWFPAKDKLNFDDPELDEEQAQSLEVPVPRAYWDAGYSLQEMLAFVTRESSFDKSSLRVATSEQLSSLLQDEELFREKVEAEQQYDRRNEGRDVYDQEMVDYLLGEVVFDGKRWHLLVGGLLAVWALIASVVLVGQLLFRPSSNVTKSKSS